MRAKIQTAALTEIIAQLGISEQELDYWSNYAVKGLGRFYREFNSTEAFPAHLVQSSKTDELLSV